MRVPRVAWEKKMPGRCLTIALLFAAGILAACGSQEDALSIETPPLQTADKIAFITNRDGNPEIYVMNADGSGPQRLTNNPTPDKGYSWSPDGRKIAFFTGRDGNSEIYVMNADGSGTQRLTNNPAEDSQPEWSPDGKKIAFASDRDGNPEIYIMNADGSALTRITDNPANDADPIWQPKET